MCEDDDEPWTRGNGIMTWKWPGPKLGCRTISGGTVSIFRVEEYVKQETSKKQVFLFQPDDGGSYVPLKYQWTSAGLHTWCMPQKIVFCKV